MSNRISSAEPLRAGIDHGQAGDKVDFPDPAASPLGTDAEAGGHPVTAQEAQIAEKHELRRPTPPSEDREQPGAKRAGLVLPVVLVSAVILVGVWALL
ncbi:MAG: hypothetical protein FJX25_18335 [Alphaproteobacteria bacterium]|nr:hypothetical protein [Alphaproteobacteria bacterium]